MEKRIKKDVIGIPARIISCIILTFIVYLVLAFIAGSWDPRNWPLGARFVGLIGLAYGWYVCAGGVIYSEVVTPKPMGVPKDTLMYFEGDASKVPAGWEVHVKLHNPAWPNTIVIKKI